MLAHVIKTLSLVNVPLKIVDPVTHAMHYHQILQMLYGEKRENSAAFPALTE
ncbi:hypothetical protein NTGHW29_130016 [Candidatus Nitrotoga sp. HW29]|nr:hypothetical protein NTGHW29_130016 [Candidatus Nitrotoga sp. HW29]